MPKRTCHARYQRFRGIRTRFTILETDIPWEEQLKTLRNNPDEMKIIIHAEPSVKVPEPPAPPPIPIKSPNPPATMTSRQFFDRVVQLRRLQKDYFATRSRESLQQAKALEKEIDQEIERVRKILAQREQSQPNLFT